jgi:hypothetical protein
VVYQREPLRVVAGGRGAQPTRGFLGPDALYQGQEVFYRKVLSDRRQEGGGLAVLSKICPPPGKMVKTVAVARSKEHVFNLRGGRVNKSGKPIEAPGNSYTLNPTGQAGATPQRDS